MAGLVRNLQTVALHPLQLFLDLTQLVLLPLDVGLNHLGLLLQLLLHALHDVQLVAELNHRLPQSDTGPARTKLLLLF